MKTIRELLAELPEAQRRQPYSESAINEYLNELWDELHPKEKSNDNKQI